MPEIRVIFVDPAGVARIGAGGVPPIWLDAMPEGVGLNIRNGATGELWSEEMAAAMTPAIVPPAIVPMTAETVFFDRLGKLSADFRQISTDAYAASDHVREIGDRAARVAGDIDRAVLSYCEVTAQGAARIADQQVSRFPYH